ncbi:IQ motif-containing protein H isoform X2 [Betta splendens]|uniref:IQ motif-containing protein H isoform X2 n=1 Tax=Betta splendens TaxID=158456 RepID=A0A9W2XVB6_BETSP|nr:IQ motif-containing protein H isoform X2 [Betta splendens]
MLPQTKCEVQDDLKQLKRSLEKISVSERGTTLDLQALDNAIRRTESCIRKHAEDYLTTLNRQLLVLPCIEDVRKSTLQIPKWKPSLETIPDVCPQREPLPEPSPGEKHKSTLAFHWLCNPAYPKNRTIIHKTCGIILPDVHKKSTNKRIHRVFTGSMVRGQTIEPKGSCNLAIPEEDAGMASDRGLLHMSVQHNTVVLHTREDPHTLKTDVIRSKSRRPKKLKWKTESRSTRDNEYSPLWMTMTPPPSTASKSMDLGGTMQDDNDFPKSPQNPPALCSLRANKYPFIIINGRINHMAPDFCHFRQSFSLCWSVVVDPLEALKRLLRNFAVPLAKVNGERLLEFGHGWDNDWRKDPPANSLLLVLENWKEVLDLVSRPGQRFKGEGGTEAAAIHIQSCWRRHVARTAYSSHCRRKWAAETISMSWLRHARMRHVRKALQARRFRQLENYRSRAQHLATNWKHIQSSKRTIIHIPSLGLSQRQRLNLRGFDILQNIQIGRLCDIKDENVEVIYVCSQHLEEDILQYYTRLLNGVSHESDTETTEVPVSRRFVVLTPEALHYFPTHNMCLSTLLKYSPCTLTRIKNLIRGKQAYIVGGVTHADDLAVADELGVPVLGPEPGIARLYSTKSGGRRMFTWAEVDVPPGQGGICSLNQLHETLAELMAQNLDVRRWLFKMDSERGARGTAFCDTCHLNCHSWALQEARRCGPDLWNTRWVQESVLLRYLDEIPEWLACYARPAKTSCYPNWTCFLKTFLRQGGVVEAYPPSDGVTCLTVDLLLEPGGEVTMLSCGDQLRGSCQLETVGSTVPQTSVHPETLRSICMRVGRACVQRLIVGYVSLDLATFVNHITMEQKVWATDLDITYSDQLAMTRMLLTVTGGALNFSSGCLEVPNPAMEKRWERHDAAEPPVISCYAVIGIHLFHTNLSMLYHYVFLKMCRTHGIGFNRKRKQGTVFAFYDYSDRCSLGMMTVSENLQGALVTFARNLSVIHQEISSSRTQGETNFKVLIKNIEDVLQVMARNKLQAVENCCLDSCCTNKLSRVCLCQL